MKHQLIVIMFFLLSQASVAQPQVKLDKIIIRSVADSVAAAVGNYYVFPVKASEMKDRILQRASGGAYDNLSRPGQLIDQLEKDLRAVHRDPHLTLRYDPDLEKRILAFKQNGSVPQEQVSKEQKQNFFFRRAEILAGNIGYISFSNFADTNALSRKTVRSALQFVAYTDALVIDLRNNFGGSPSMAAEIAGYFFKEETATGKTYSRLTGKWTENRVKNDPVVTGGLLLEMPLYLLTSERTYSAAEGLAYTLQHLRNAVLVGDTTRGGAHASRSFALGNGFVAFIPYSRSENLVTGTDWEGKGVAPSISVDEGSALSRARQYALEQQLAVATNDVEKRKINWLINDLQAQRGALAVDSITLAACAGSFEEFLFTVENGRLFCRNTHQRDKKDLLAAITESLFKIDEQSQVEFIREEGAVRQVKILWSDGWIDLIGRAR
jgi:retinol-binding protein 3